MSKLSSLVLMFYFMSIFSFSIYLKCIRYDADYQDNSQVKVERLLQEKLKEQNWVFKYTKPLTMNKTNQLMAFTHEKCNSPLYISVLGRDASDHSLLSNALSTDNIRFFFDGVELKRLIISQAYFYLLYNRLSSLLLGQHDNNARLLGVYQPSDSPQCQLPNAIEQKSIISTRDKQDSIRI